MSNITDEEFEFNGTIIEYIELLLFAIDGVIFLTDKIKIGKAWRQYWSLSFILINGIL